MNEWNVIPLTQLLDAFQASLQSVIDNYNALKPYATVTQDNIGSLIQLILNPAMNGFFSKLPTLNQDKFYAVFKDIPNLGTVETAIFQIVLDRVPHSS